MKTVVDTSVALKWYVQEEHSALARQLLEQELAAPDFILVELANALWKKIRKGEIKSGQAADALAHIPEMIKFVDSSLLVEAALNLAIDLAHPVYDCLFLVLAEEMDVRLVTSDQRFCRHVAGTAYAKRVTSLEGWRANG